MDECKEPSKPKITLAGILRIFGVVNYVSSVFEGLLYLIKWVMDKFLQILFRNVVCDGPTLIILFEMDQDQGIVNNTTQTMCLNSLGG